MGGVGGRQMVINEGSAEVTCPGLAASSKIQTGRCGGERAQVALGLGGFR
jgi:hypothetical protein